MFCKSTSEVPINARSSAYMGAPQKTPSIDTPKEEVDSWSKSAFTKMEYRRGDRIEPWRTPCLMGKERDTWESHTTAEIEQLYHTSKICQIYGGTLHWKSLTKRPACHTVSKAFLTSRKATKAFFFFSRRKKMAS